MGGNALPKSLSVMRLSVEQLNSVQQKLQTELSAFIWLEFPKELPDKTSFGDVDVMYLIVEELRQSYLLSIGILNLETESNEIREKYSDKHYAQTLIQAIFNPEALIVNGCVFSFSMAAKDSDGENIPLNKVSREMSQLLSYADASPQSNEQQYFQIDFIKCYNLEHLQLMQFCNSYGDVKGKKAYVKLFDI